MSAALRPTPAMVNRAAQWAAELDADNVSPLRRAACEAWCAEDGRHRLAFDRMQSLDSRFADLAPMERGALSRAARHRPMRRGGALLAILLLAGGAWMIAHSFAARQYFPDIKTAPGEIHALALEDGSTVQVDTDSALSTELDDDRRHVRLFRGRVMAQVARDPQRPFVVETQDGTATALGTQYSVSRDAGGTLVTVIESRVRACATAMWHSDCVTLNPGQRARLAGGKVERLTSVDVDRASAWSKGWLEADDMPVADALAELNRYRARPIRFDPAALAGITITGSYPLRDSDRALAAIAGASGLWVGRVGEDQAVTRDP